MRSQYPHSPRRRSYDILASILHALTNGLRGLLDSMAAKPYPRPRIALSEYDCQKDTNRSAVVNQSACIHRWQFRVLRNPRRSVMAKTKFRPLHDRVVVKRIDAEEKTKGGIIIPDTAKEKPSQGAVTAAGPGG